MHNYIDRLLLGIGVIIALFPYISPVNTGTDVQPYAMIYSILISLRYIRFRYSRIMWILWVIMLVSIALFPLSSMDFGSIRNFANYVSFFFVALLGYICIYNQKIFTRRMVLSCGLIWILIGIIQATVSRSFATQLISASRTSMGRGVTSLAPEPTYYASILLILILCSLVLRERRWVYIIYASGILFLARSTQVVIILICAALPIYILALFVRNLRLTAVATLVAGLASAIILYYFAEHSRIVQISSAIARDPHSFWLVVSGDASAMERVTQAILSLISPVLSYGLPHGLDPSQWIRFRHDVGAQLGVVSPVRSDRIGSGLGMIFFELGIFGVLFLGIIIDIGRRLRGSIAERIFWIGCYVGLSASMIPLGHASMNFLLGLAIGSIADREKREAADDLLPAVSSNSNGDIWVREPKEMRES